MRSAASAFFLLICMALHAQANDDLDAFHRSIIDKDSTAQESPAPAVHKYVNPHVKPFASVISASIWPNRTISVCWENPSEEHAMPMQLTRSAVIATWGSKSALRFTGWEKCAPMNRGIRIEIADAGPHVKSLGRFLDNMKNGMVLNFNFNNWGGSYCLQNKESCIRSIAVHEFGHAIGLTHEQNRADAPGECQRLKQGSAPDTHLTPYDPSSVMNYCNDIWNNNGLLSELDIAAAQEIYGAP